MTDCGRALKPRQHHNFAPKITEASGTCEKYRYSRPSMAPLAAYAEPTFLHFIIGLWRNQLSLHPSNYSDRFHHRHRSTENSCQEIPHEIPPSFEDIGTRGKPSDARGG
jgi:hypothetical protein